MAELKITKELAQAIIRWEEHQIACAKGEIIEKQAKLKDMIATLEKWKEEFYYLSNKAEKEMK